MKERSVDMPPPSPVTVVPAPKPAPKSVEAALDVVGLTVTQVLSLLGSLADGRIYLVGSLAAGLGNAGSDVDLQILVDGDDSGGVPLSFFEDGVLVDVQYLDAKEPASVASALTTDMRSLAGASCALGPVPPGRTQNRISRWITGLPFDVASPPLLDQAQVEPARAMLVRAALDTTVRFAAVAQLADMAGQRSGAAWRRTARAALELLARASGESFAIEKWVWKKATRAGVAQHLVSAASTAATAAEFEALWASAGLPAFDPLSLAAVRTGNFEQRHLAGRQFLFVNGRRLVDMRAPEPGDLADVVAAIGALTVLEALTEQVLTLDVDVDAIDRVVSG